MELAEEELKILKADFDSLLADYSPIEIGRQARTVDIVFAYRMLLGRMPVPGEELDSIISNLSTWREFFNGLLSGGEFSNRLDLLPDGMRLMSETNGFRFWFDSMDREMGARMATGTYEPESSAIIRKVLGPGMVCLDIGAQTGFYTCLMAQIVGPNGQVIAFEPMDRSFNLLEKNIEENNWQDRVVLHHVACSDSSGEIKVGVASGMVVAASNGDHTINSIKIDDMDLQHVDFCKIDIEGHEPKAISGMEDLLSRADPILLTEVNQYWLRQAGSSAPEYLELLGDFQYRLFDLEGNFGEIEKYESEDPLDNINILAIPRDRCAELLQLVKD